MDHESNKARSPVGQIVSEVSLLFRYVISGFVAFLVAAFVEGPPPDGQSGVLHAVYIAAEQNWAVVAVIAAIVGMLTFAINTLLLLPPIEFCLRRQIKKNWGDDDWLNYTVQRWTRRHADPRATGWMLHTAFQRESDKWANTLHFLYASAVAALVTPPSICLLGFDLALGRTIAVYSLAICTLVGLVGWGSRRHIQLQVRFTEMYPYPSTGAESSRSNQSITAQQEAASTATEAEEDS